MAGKFTFDDSFDWTDPEAFAGTITGEVVIDARALEPGDDDDDAVDIGTDE